MLGDDQNLQTVRDKLVHAGGMRKLAVDGTKVKIFLSTLEKKNSHLDSYLILIKVILSIFQRFILDPRPQSVKTKFQLKKMWTSGHK